MELISFDHTLATLIKTKNDLRKLLDIIVALTQVMFGVFYTYELVKNLNTLYLLIIYACLIGISIGYLIAYIIHRKIGEKENKKNNFRIIKKIFSFSKYLLKLASVSFGIYQIATKDVTSVMILLTALSIFMLLLNIVVEVITTYVEKTINRFIVAFYMDREENSLNKLIVNELDMEKANIPNAEDLKEEIKSDKEKYIFQKDKSNKKDSWIVKRIKKEVEKHIGEK